MIDHVVTLVVTVLSTVLELGARWRRVRFVLAIADLFVICFGIGWVLAHGLSVGTLLFVLVSLYRIVNALRLLEGRMHERYLVRNATRTLAGLTTIQLLILGVRWLWQYAEFQLSHDQAYLFWAIVMFVCAVPILAGTISHLLRSRVRAARILTERQLPTLSVCIPARNETESLNQALSALVANDYPKLEILVLDDCSQDKTPEVIKQFAQKGVRFVAGVEPDTNWLARNQAYEILAAQASGDILLFTGVDVRLDTNALRVIVGEMATRNVSMVSVMPLRYLSSPLAAFIQPMRYWWEFALPRWLIGRPPVLSTCWAIRRDEFKRLGGLSAVKRMLVPESYFARKLARNGQYEFLRAGNTLGVQTHKNLNDQLETAIRSRYPQVHHRLVGVMLLSLAEALLWLGPFALFVVGWIYNDPLVMILTAGAALALIAAHALIVHISNPSNGWFALLNFPVVVLLDILLLNYSMWQYEFGVIEWKGRNICLPVMHVYPSLPKLK